MITRATIIRSVDGSDGYLWWVNIPILDGKPDSLSEKEKFSAYYNSLNQVQTTSSDVKQNLLKTFLNRNKQTVVTQPITISEQERRFERVAHVCGTPNSKIHYLQGDVVIVGFENNDMGKPIILGALLTKDLNYDTTDIDMFNISLLSVLIDNDSSVSLPLSSKTTFKRDGIATGNKLNSFSAEDLEDVVLFKKTFDELGLNLTTIKTLLTALTPLEGNVTNLLKWSSQKMEEETEKETEEEKTE